jgi:N-carbamoyl-L-amino-acid hydrolase
VSAHADRIGRRIETLAGFTEPDRPYTRRAFTPPYERARTWLSDEMRSAGLEVRLDAGANLLAVRAGATPDAAAWMLGSHIDTVPAGGRFDGVAGVVCALEVADMLREAGASLHRPLCVVDFLSEEPSEYGPSCIGSRAWAGTLSEAMLTAAGPNGEALEAAIVRMGGDPAAIRRGPVADLDVAGFLELHIEQGRRLEAANRPVGLVDGIVAVQRHRWRIVGEAAHAGTTPMTERRDALVGAAELVATVHERALDEAASHPFVATVGRLEVVPNGINVVPGAVELVLETRALDEARLTAWYAEVEAEARQATERRGLDLETHRISTAPAVRSDPRLLDALRASARSLGHEPPTLVSGAGHDAMQVASRAPAAMLFVPSVAGVSHAPHEATATRDLAVGAEVLAGAILRLDAAT